jgi:type I restriction enzyme M protein
LTDVTEGAAIAEAMTRAQLGYRVFLGEANHVGYIPVGTTSTQNDLYRSGGNGVLAADQTGTILHEWRTFRDDSERYQGSVMPDCMAVPFSELWLAHASHRLDPKYHLFKREATRHIPNSWVRETIGNVMQRREEEANFTANPDWLYQVMTISQTGEIRAREAGKGRKPPEWRASYFEVSPGSWFAARMNDVVFSSIDLWKGCIATVPGSFDGALVTNEFPIYEVTDERLSPLFLQVLLRSWYYQRAFRAITAGHSNRRRTQAQDFEALEIAFPPDRAEQERLIAEIASAREQQREASETLRTALAAFSDRIDARGAEELPDVDGKPTEDEE